MKIEQMQQLANNDASACEWQLVRRLVCAMLHVTITFDSLPVIRIDATQIICNPKRGITYINYIAIINYLPSGSLVAG